MNGRNRLRMPGLRIDDVERELGEVAGGPMITLSAQIAAERVDAPV